MLLRPYQVHALQAIEGAALGWDNDDKIKHGGFIWHTTGSGKTITSFKTALFLSTRGGFDKVVFCGCKNLIIGQVIISKPIQNMNQWR